MVSSFLLGILGLVFGFIVDQRVGGNGQVMIQGLAAE